MEEEGGGARREGKRQVAPLRTLCEERGSHCRTTLFLRPERVTWGAPHPAPEEDARSSSSEAKASS